MNPLPEPKVVAVYICAEPGGPMVSVSSAEAISGAGLVGDRYFSGENGSSKPHQPDRELTLIEEEAIEAVNRDLKLPLTAAECRRNVVTAGVPLNHLVGKVFRVGAVKARGVELCEPCSHLQKLTRPGVLKALLHRGGLRAEILESGELKVGDPVEFVETERADTRE